MRLTLHPKPPLHRIAEFKDTSLAVLISSEEVSVFGFIIRFKSPLLIVFETIRSRAKVKNNYYLH